MKNVTQKARKKVQSIIDGAQERLLSGFLTFISILLGVFTYSLVESLKSKGLVTGRPWDVLAIISGFSISASGVISLVLFYYSNKPIPLIWGVIIIFLFVAILATCSIGVPIIGWWIYN